MSCRIRFTSLLVAAVTLISYAPNAFAASDKKTINVQDPATLLKEAQQKGDRLIAQAKKDAAALLKNAQAEAKQINLEAKIESDTLTRNAKATYDKP